MDFYNKIFLIKVLSKSADTNLSIREDGKWLAWFGFLLLGGTFSLIRKDREGVTLHWFLLRCIAEYSEWCWARFLANMTRLTIIL